MTSNIALLMRNSSLSLDETERAIAVFRKSKPDMSIYNILGIYQALGHRRFLETVSSLEKLSCVMRN